MLAFLPVLGERLHLLQGGALHPELGVVLRAPVAVGLGGLRWDFAVQHRAVVVLREVVVAVAVGVHDERLFPQAVPAVPRALHRPVNGAAHVRALVCAPLA